MQHCNGPVFDQLIPPIFHPSLRKLQMSVVICESGIFAAHQKGWLANAALSTYNFDCSEVEHVAKHFPIEPLFMEPEIFSSD